MSANACKFLIVVSPKALFGTFIILKRLCERGIFKNEGGVVTSLISKNMFLAKQSEEVVAESFNGSLPSFVAAFTSQKKLSSKEIDEIRKKLEDIILDSIDMGYIKFEKSRIKNIRCVNEPGVIVIEGMESK